MKYKELIPSCKKAIENEWCLGCQALEDPNFVGIINCKYSKSPTVQQSLNQIWRNLGVQQKIDM